MPNPANEIKLAQERAKGLGVPLADLTGKLIPPQVLREMTEEAATFYQFVPLEKRGNVLDVGMLNPDDIKSQEALRFIAQNKNFVPKIFLITDNDFKNVLKQYRTLKEEVDTALSELEKELSVRDETAGNEDRKLEAESALERVMAEAPITKIVAVILRHANEGRASDIHIEPVEDRLKIRFRVDGILYTSLLLPRAIQPAVVSRIKILSSLKIDETRVPQDGRFHSVIDNNKIDFRVSTFPTAFGEKVVLRLLDPSQGVRTFEQLGLDGHNRQVVEEAIGKPFGMILLSGPTGSGKTTTLYAILKTLNEEAVNIVSLEDPVEYYIEGVSQSQIKPEIGYSFASGLRSILRQDPDVIMVGEIRDSETAELATHAALTGHIVLSTIHTNNAVGVIPRLTDMGVQRFLIPSALSLAMSQRLLRRLCTECKKAIEPAPKVKELLAREVAELPTTAKESVKDVDFKNLKIWQAPGCKFCAQKGTKGRIAIFEALTMTPQLEQIVVEGATEGKIAKEAARQGMTTMKQDGIIKVLRGVISFEELIGSVEVLQKEAAEE
ncbi:MAG: GspE/PulE family protein [Candidatus Portnoybacteria bacterium]|nr:GspE/PulE family protein [Candidatus Portnoybacteria bacterium]MDD4982886.1 GspE/PulE family protein [Candidatus Portnoybacteria bacterium]